MLSIEPVIKEDAFWVDLVEDGISIALVTGCKNDDFPVLLHLLKEGDGVGADVEPYLKGVSVDTDG